MRTFEEFAKPSKETVNLKNHLDTEGKNYTYIIQDLSIIDNRLHGNVFYNDLYDQGVSVITGPIYSVDEDKGIYSIMVKSGSVFYVSSFKDGFDMEEYYINEC